MREPSAHRNAGMRGAGFPRFILLAPLVPFMLGAASPADAQPNAPLPSPSPAAAASAARHIGPAERDFLPTISRGGGAPTLGHSGRGLDNANTSPSGRTPNASPSR